MKIKIDRVLMLSKELIIRRDHWQINNPKMSFLKRKKNRTKIKNVKIKINNGQWIKIKKN